MVKSPFLPLKSPFSRQFTTVSAARAPQGRAGDVGVGAHDFGRQGPDPPKHGIKNDIQMIILMVY